MTATLRVPTADDNGDIVKERFSSFLQNFKLTEDVPMKNNDGEIVMETRQVKLHEIRQIDRH